MNEPITTCHGKGDFLAKLFLIRMSIDEFAIFQVSSRQRQQWGAEKTHEEEDVEEDVEGDVEEDGEEEWWKLPNWGTYF